MGDVLACQLATSVAAAVRGAHAVPLLAIPACGATHPFPPLFCQTFSYDQIKAAVEKEKPAVLFLCQVRNGAAAGWRPAWLWGQLG